MFGLPYTLYVHRSALRFWNCVARFANVVWLKLNHLREPIMPRSRRRHHSRSRSRSRSHSHDRDREPKRRKVESYESPQPRRSVSSQPEDSTDTTSTTDRKIDSNSTSTTSLYNTASENTPMPTDVSAGNSTVTVNTDEGIGTEDTLKENDEKETKSKDTDNEEETKLRDNDEETEKETKLEDNGEKETEAKLEDKAKETEKDLITPSKIKTKIDAVKVTPTRRLTPKQRESEKKKQQRQKEKEEREQKKQDEMEQKREKLEQKQKEKQEKLKELEEKKKATEQRRKEKEEKEEQKRKEKEQEKIKKQQEIDEKTREKQKIEEQKRKAAAAFTKFFVPKKVDSDKREEVAEKKNQNFMPFEKKSDMKLAPITRATISEERKSDFDQSFTEQTSSALYLSELKSGKKTGKSGKTWPLQLEDDDDVLIIGESIEEEKPKLEKMRTKFLSFVENQRPPYYGTFRKKSKTIIPTKPFRKDEDLFNYEVESEEEWDEEGEGESLKGTDDEDEEEGNDSDEGKDYEVDNKLFVPHGHLSDDEVDDEVDCKLSPESHKAKLKLLKNEFDEDRKSKQHKLKPSVIGCIWYSKVRTKAEEAFDKYLQPFAIISNGRIEIKRRSELTLRHSVHPGRLPRLLSNEHIPIFLKYLHASTRKAKDIVKGFLEHLNTIGVEADVSQMALGKQLRQFAEWTKTKENGAKKKYWLVKDDVQQKFNLDLPLPSKNDLDNTKREVSPE